MFKRIAILLLTAQCCLGVEFGIAGSSNGYFGKEYPSFMVMNSGSWEWEVMYSNPLQWLSSVLGTEAIDQTTNELDANITGVNCLSGTAVTITAPHLGGTETVVSNDGTSTPVITANTITFTGTLGNLVLSDGTIYPCSEGVGLPPYDTSGAGNDATVTDATWATSDLIPSANLINGCSKVLSFDGGDIVNCGTVELSLQYDDTLTIDTSLRFDSYTPNIQYIATKWLPVAPYNGWYFRHQKTENTLNFAIIKDATHSLKASCPEPTVDDWCDIVLTYDGSGNASGVAISFDGSPQAMTTVLDTLGTDAVSYSGISLLIGGRSDKATGLTGDIEYFNFIHGNNPTYSAAESYGTTLVDGTGTANGTLDGAIWNYLPALADGTDDVEGLGLTNPSEYMYNNFEGFVQQKAANTNFLDNAFWSTDGTNYDEKSFGDLRTHLNFEENVVICSTPSSILAVWTYLQSKDWRATEYINYLDYLSGEGCTGDTLIPYPVTGGGIGPDGLWFTEDYIHIYLVKDG